MHQRTRQIKEWVAHSIYAWLELAEKRQHRRVRMWGTTTLAAGTSITPAHRAADGDELVWQSARQLNSEKSAIHHRCDTEGF